MKCIFGLGVWLCDWVGSIAQGIMNGCKRFLRLLV